MGRKYQDGEKVCINKPTVREHGVTGTVTYYNPDTQWYSVELDNGPPFRGKYEEEELTPNAAISRERSESA